FSDTRRPHLVVARLSPMSYLFHCRAASPPDPPSFPTRRSSDLESGRWIVRPQPDPNHGDGADPEAAALKILERHGQTPLPPYIRSEEHTSELQSHLNLVCRLLLEKKQQNQQTDTFALHPCVTHL